jgi:hypothetical protein
LLAFLPEQGTDLERGRSPGLQVAEQVGDREPGIDDVLDQENVAVGDLVVQVLEYPHDTG